MRTMLTSRANVGCLTRTLVLMVGVLLSAHLLPGIHVHNGAAAFWTAVAITFLDSIICPVLQILALPFILITMGLFLFIVNGVVIMMASGLVSGFEVDHLGWAVLMSLILTALNYLLEWVSKRSQQQPFQERRFKGRPKDDDHFDDYEEIQ